jgi:hypothetical protein
VHAEKQYETEYEHAHGDRSPYEAPGLEGNFPGREKQDVFPAAPMDGFTASRETPSDYVRL